MEMREVEVFLAVAEELHFGRAAERLRLSRARVSQSVRILERRVGGPLLERSTRRVSLTPLGRQLLAEFRPAYDQLQRGLSDARRSAGLATDGLRIGFATVSFADTTDAVVAALSDDPRIDRRIVSSWHPPNDLYRWLRRGYFEVDVFFSWFPDTPDAVPATLRAGAAIRSEPVGVMMPRRHPLSGRREIDVEELADHDVLHPSGHAEQADAWVPPNTPAGRPIRRVRLPYEYMEDLPRVMAETDLLHITMAAQLDQYPVPASATVVALAGLPPIVYRAVWPRAADTETLRTVAAIAAEVGDRQGWPRHARGDAHRSEPDHDLPKSP